MTPAPEVKLMRIKATGEVVEVQRVNGKWVKRATVDAGTPIVDGRADISATVNAQAGASAPSPAPEAPAAPEPSVWDRVLGGAKDAAVGAQNFGNAAMRGMGRVVTFENDDEAAGTLADWLSKRDPFSLNQTTPPALAGGNDSRALAVADARRDKQEVAANNPVPDAIGRGVGAGIMAAAGARFAPALLGVAPQVLGANTAAGWGAGVLGAGLTGAATGYGESEQAGQAAIDEAATRSMQDMALSGGFPLAAQAVGKGISAVRSSGAGRYLGEKADALADTLRGAAVGGYGGKGAQLANERGLDFVMRDFGQSVERELPSATIAGIPIPRSPAAFAEQAAPVRERLGAEIRQAVDDASGAQGVTGTLRDALGGVRSAKAARAGDPTEEAVAETQRLRELRQNMIKQYADPELSKKLDTPLTPRQLHDLKTKLEGRGYGDVPGAPISDASARTINREVAAGPRDTLHKAMREQAHPDTERQFFDANTRYPNVALAEQLAKERAGRSVWSDFVSLPTMVAGAGAAGAQTLNDSGVIDAGLTAIGTAGVVGAARRYGPDMMANAARGAANLPSRADAVAQFAGKATSGPGAGMALSMANSGQQQSGPREHELTRAARYVLNARPELLGKYAEEIEEALATPGKLGGFMQRRMRDREFATTVMPVLQAAQKGQELPQ